MHYTYSIPALGVKNPYIFIRFKQFRVYFLYPLAKSIHIDLQPRVTKVSPRPHCHARARMVQLPQNDEERRLRPHETHHRIKQRAQSARN